MVQAAREQRGKKVLVFFQHLEDLERLFEGPYRRMGASWSWYLLSLNDTLSTLPMEMKAVPRCTLLSLDALDVDWEGVWKDARALQDELWCDLAQEPRKHLHISSQRYAALLLLNRVYSHSVARAAISKTHPDELWILYSSGQLFARVRTAVAAAAAEAGILCRTDRRWAWRELVARVGAVIGYAQCLGLVMVEDLWRVVRWAGYKILGGSKKRSPFADTGDSSQTNGYILLANHGTDLPRQFNINRLSAELSARCLVWEGVGETKIVPLASGSQNGGQAPHSAAIAVEEVVHRVFPTLMLPIVRHLGSLWFCELRPRRPSRLVSPRLFRLLACGTLIGERLLNYRRAVFYARHFALCRDLLKVLKPALVVGSDMIDHHRTLILAARECGVRSMATSHAIDTIYDYLDPRHPVADTHCVFSHAAAHLTSHSLPGVHSRRVVLHDSFTCPGPGAPRRAHRADHSRPRVLIFTALYSGGFWPKGLIVDEHAYRCSLPALIEELDRSFPGVEVIIKCHPSGDDYPLYEQVQERLPGVVGGVWRDIVHPDTPVPADVVVMFNCVSTLLFTVLSQGVPTVAHWGGLTALGRRIFATSRLYGSADVPTLAGMIREILCNPEGTTAKDALSHAHAFWQTWIEPSKGGLSEALTLAAGRAVDLSYDKTTAADPALCSRNLFQ